MSGYRVITADEAFDLTDGVEAAIKHTRNVANNVGSLLLQTFDDALPDEVMRKPEVLDIYTYDPERATRSRRVWTLGKPQPAFPREGVLADYEVKRDGQVVPLSERAQQATNLHASEWRTRAFYYALGQIESLWELSPLVTEDAVSFSYTYENLVRRGPDGTASNLSLREAWVEWEAGRRANLEQHGRPQVAPINLTNAALQPHLAGGEHDPDLGNEPSE